MTHIVNAIGAVRLVMLLLFLILSPIVVGITVAVMTGISLITQQPVDSYSRYCAFFIISFIAAAIACPLTQYLASIPAFIGLTLTLTWVFGKEPPLTLLKAKYAEIVLKMMKCPTVPDYVDIDACVINTQQKQLLSAPEERQNRLNEVTTASCISKHANLRLCKPATPKEKPKKTPTITTGVLTVKFGKQ